MSNENNVFEMPLTKAVVPLRHSYLLITPCMAKAIAIASEKNRSIQSLHYNSRGTTSTYLEDGILYEVLVRPLGPTGKEPA